VRSMTLKSYVAPLVGMTFFWTYLRHQTVFGTLYPLNTTIPLSDFSVQIYAVFLLVLFVLSLLALFFASALEKVFLNRRLVIVLFAAMGSLGAFLCLGAQRGLYADWAYLLSTILISVGFLANCLAWAVYFSSRFGPSQIILLAVSYLASLVIFNAIGIYFPIAKDYVLVLVPLCIGLTWLFANAPRAQVEARTWASLKKISPYIVLFVAFLLAGSVVRGIVDLEDPIGRASYLRWGSSVVVSVLILIACVRLKRSTTIPRSNSLCDDGDEYASIERMALKCWVVLAVMFFAGTFICLISGTYTIGGHIVVVARSSLDFFLWVLLCNLAFQRKAAPIPLFIVCNILTGVVSLFLSYVVIPYVAALETGMMKSSFEMFVLTIVFALIALIVVVFGVIMLRANSVKTLPGSEAMESMPFLPEDKVCEHKLTKREIEVIGYLACGYTLGAVAAKLFISKSTAQTHVKSAYRKLGVHSKDDLIETISSWTRG